MVIQTAVDLTDSWTRALPTACKDEQSSCRLDVKHTHMTHTHTHTFDHANAHTQAEEARQKFQARYGHVEHVAEYWLRQWGGLKTGGVTEEAFSSRE